MDVVLKEKEDIPAGRAFRQHIPLLTGENVINFHAYGEAGLPVSGEALLAIQAFPLGCKRSTGRLLAVHSDNPRLMLHFARSFLVENQYTIELGQGMVEHQHLQGTLLIETLLKADIGQRRVEQRQVEKEKQPFSLTVYHLASGKVPRLDIYHLPLQIIEFLREMRAPDYDMQWSKIVDRAWEIEPQKKRKKKEDKPFEPRRNWLYEDILRLYDGPFLQPDRAKRFLRTYFLRQALRYSRGNESDPRANYGLTHEIGLVSWNITLSFLRRVFNMEEGRIEEIRKMGDRLAKHINKHNDHHLFTNFRHRNYSVFRTALLRANYRQIKSGNSPIIEFDPYIEIFEHAENDSHLNWRLTRDLVFLRMIEQLHKLGWFDRNTDVELEIDVEEEEGQSE